MAWMAALLLLPAAITPVSAQTKRSLSVASFQQDPFDGSARNPQFSRKDGNGDLFAIVKVKTTNPTDDLTAYNFNFGNMRHEVDAAHDGELWLYVQRNARLVTITREGYTTINKYELSPAIEAGSTYVLVLNAQAPRVEKRILQFKVSPTQVDALVRVKREGSTQDYEPWGAVDAAGSIAQRIETGTWLYEVTAQHYQTSTGRVKLVKGNGPQIENVTLLPAYGYLEVADAGGFSGADIFIDNRRIATIPYNGKDRWDIGEHRIDITKGELYKPFTATVTINAGETTQLKPKLEANFAETTITVDADADIYIDGEKVGTRQWRGPLKAGSYTVECRQANCKPSSRLVVVNVGYGETVRMEPPQPIIGALSVVSNPTEATILLDGVNIGVTPLESKRVNIGNHQVQVSKKGYKPQTKTISIAEGADEELNFTLELTSKPKAPKAKKPASDDKSGTSFGGSVFAGLQVGSLMGAEIGAGLRIGGFTVEAGYLLGLSKSDAVYWNYDTDTEPIETVYKPTAIALRLGYTFGKGSLQFTPQVGARILSVSSEGGDSKCNATSATLGLRLDYRLAKSVSLFATPEVAFALNKSSIYEQVADVSSDVKNWGTGFNARVGLSINF